MRLEETFHQLLEHLLYGSPSEAKHSEITLNSGKQIEFDQMWIQLIAPKKLRPLQTQRPDVPLEPEPKANSPLWTGQQWKLIEVLRMFGATHLKPTSTAVEVKTAYRRLIRRLHPDSFAGRNLDERQQVLLREAFLRVQQAYERLERTQ